MQGSSKISNGVNKTIINIIITAVVVGGISFYGGMKYAQSKTPQGRLAQTNFQNLQNLSPEERQQRLQQFGASGSGLRGGGGRGAGGGLASGEIISKGDKDLTIKLRDGGSRIILFSDSTEINKSIKGAPNDLAVGKNVVINGAANSDGSISAETIQLRTPVNGNQPQ